jgi:biotin operon repressor
LSHLKKFKAETERLVQEATFDGSPLHRVHRLFDVRFERICDAVAIKARTAISADPLDAEGAIDHLAEQVRVALKRELEAIAIHRGPDALTETQRRVREVNACLEAFEQASCAGVLGRRAGPSWLDLRAECQSRLATFRLWVLSIDGLATRIASASTNSEIQLTETEQRILNALGPVGKSSQTLKKECELSSADTVRGHIQRMKKKGIKIDNDASRRYILK